MNLKRVRLLKSGVSGNGPVVYWMSRDQRVRDNWAFAFAHEKSLRDSVPLVVVFCLVPDFLEATIRQYGFMLDGLKEVERDLAELKVPFYLLEGDPSVRLPEFLKGISASSLITDFDPLKVKRKWKEEIGESISIPFYEVDAHNIVPAFQVSAKEEFAAYTLRPKINRVLDEFLDEFPEPAVSVTYSGLGSSPVDWDKVRNNLKIDFSVKEVEWIKPGSGAALEAAEEFIRTKLDSYDTNRNNPVLCGQSGLSPYIHFGQISAQRVVLNILNRPGHSGSREAFLEELIVRRELADNFCLYNNNYDSFEGFRSWAKKTLVDHLSDEREFIYTLKEFESASTHEDLWNAAQTELAATGKMHGFMRMYWAKKILEWSVSPAEALKTAIYLNDKYELDGRDPNGYAGCAWAIGGVHDRAWFERPVYGKIRYMNRNGCARKFDVEEYAAACGSGCRPPASPGE